MRDDLIRVAHFNAAYADCIDHDELERLSAFFTDDCHYKITTWDNWRAGYPAGIVYLRGTGMLRDRISAMRNANVFEPHRYRHMLGLPSHVLREGNGLTARTPFSVFRIMQDGTTALFATGEYIDRFTEGGEHDLQLSERLVVCDSARMDTLLVIPL